MPGIKKVRPVMYTEELDVGDDSGGALCSGIRKSMDGTSGSASRLEKKQ